MKKINKSRQYILYILLLISTYVFSQDKIYLKSGESLETIILEVNNEDIKYKKFTHQEGPTYTVLKSDVHMILYKNGESEIFKNEVKTSITTVNNTNVNVRAVKERKPLNGGGPKIGMFVGLPVGEYARLREFSLGAEFAYLGEVAPNFEIGGLIGYSHYFGGEYIDYDYTNDYEDVGFIPIAFSSRYYFVDRKLFAGIDLGYAIGVTGSVDGGFYLRPKFGVNLGAANLILSYSSIRNIYNYYYYNYYNYYYNESSINFGVEFNLTR